MALFLVVRLLQGATLRRGGRGRSSVCNALRARPVLDSAPLPAGRHSVCSTGGIGRGAAREPRPPCAGDVAIHRVDSRPPLPVCRPAMPLVGLAGVSFCVRPSPPAAYRVRLYMDNVDIYCGQQLARIALPSASWWCSRHRINPKDAARSSLFPLRPRAAPGQPGSQWKMLCVRRRRARQLSPDCEAVFAYEGQGTV